MAATRWRTHPTNNMPTLLECGLGSVDATCSVSIHAELRGSRSASGAGNEAKGMSRFVVLAALVAAIGGALFGYDTGVISGAILFIRPAFGLGTIDVELVVSAVLIGATLGAIASARVTDKLGRRTVLLAAAASFAVGAIGSALAPNPTSLVAARLLIGLAIGVASYAVPLYISELSPADSRGWLVSLNQLFITLGIVFSYVVDYAFSGTGAWRWMLGLAVVPALMLFVGVVLLPETPRWLVKNGQPLAARRVLMRLRPADCVDSELFEIEATARLRGSSWAELLSRPMRLALVVGIGLAILQQVTGINTVIYYAPTIMQMAGIPSASGAILATTGVGVVNVLMTIVAMLLLDRVGRRPLLLGGMAVMAFALFALGLAFLLPGLDGGLSLLAVALLMLYVGAFAISLGPIFWLLISEIYPLRLRGLAAGVATTANWASNLVVSLTFLSLIEDLGTSTTFWLYGVVSIMAIVFAYRLVPETKGHTLEELDLLIDRPAPLPLDHAPVRKAA
jgi:sugar porter (SP) family MFS transporter